MMANKRKTIMKERRKRKILAISAGLITLSLIAVTQGDKIKHMYVSITQPEQKVENTNSQEYNTSIFHSLVEKPGVILTKGSLLTIIGPPLGEDIDAVTSATPSVVQNSDKQSNE